MTDQLLSHLIYILVLKSYISIDFFCLSYNEVLNIDLSRKDQYVLVCELSVRLPYYLSNTIVTEDELHRQVACKFFSQNIPTVHSRGGSYCVILQLVTINKSVWFFYLVTIEWRDDNQKV